MKHVQDNDYEFEPEDTSVWITVGNLSLCVRKLDGAIKLTVYELGKENDGYLFEDEILEQEPLTDIA